jgi:hypothetical protein
MIGALPRRQVLDELRCSQISMAATPVNAERVAAATRSTCQ